MNKKIAALLIPLLLIPLASFGYAHFFDIVEKRYKIHVGSIIANITYFHVDYVRMLDVDQDDVLFDDEVNITIFYDPGTCKWIAQIIVDPITGGFVLNTTMKIHNSGKLPWELWWDVYSGGPYDDDPSWVTPPVSGLGLFATPPWSYKMDVYKENETGTFGPFAPTQTKYHPCDNATIKQHVNFMQPDPADPDTAAWQKTWQCKWVTLWIVFEAREPDLTTDSSWTWP